MVKLAELKSMVGNVIDENTEQAAVDFHKYFGSKVQLAAGIITEMKKGDMVMDGDKKLGKIKKVDDDKVMVGDKEYDKDEMEKDPDKDDCWCLKKEDKKDDDKDDE